MAYPEELHDSKLEITLSLEGEEGDRWRVSVKLSPRDEPVYIDGATVVLVDEFARPLGPAVVLPIAGQIADEISLFANVQGPHPMKPGSKLRCTAFYSGGQTPLVVEEPLSARCGFGSYVLGEQAVMPISSDPEIHLAEDEDRVLLEQAFPWLTPAECGFGSSDLFEEDLLDSLSEQAGSVTEEILRMLRED